MTTYVLGAGASYHAGYPLCSQLWPRMAAWAIQMGDSEAPYLKAISTIAVLNGPVADLEVVFTDLDCGRGAFSGLKVGDRNRLRGQIKECLRTYFMTVLRSQETPRLYAALAEKVTKGDIAVTFNYDLCCETELIRAGKFRVRDGYGFEAKWDEPNSDVTVLKPHGSINWIGSLFGGISGSGGSVNSLGDRPFVDNHESILPVYESRVLDKSFRGGGVVPAHTNLILPSYEKRYAIGTSVDDHEWASFYEAIWARSDEAVERAHKIVVIGYSMPEADRRSRAMLLWNQNKSAAVDLYCGDSNAALKVQFETHGFRRVSSRGTFEDFAAI